MKNRDIAGAAMAIAALGAALPAAAVDVKCTFEDGGLCGFLESTTGGSGSTGVETHNGDKSAFAKHADLLTHALARDFDYIASASVSFDMQAIAVPSGSANAYSGVTVSFLNSFNVALGSFSLFNTTNPGGLGARQFSIDNLEHTYTGTMEGFASQAGLSSSAPIAKMNLSYIAYAEGYTVCCTSRFSSTASTWFDNVTVSAVPEPAQALLLLAGLGSIALLAPRRGGIDR